MSEQTYVGQDQEYAPFWVPAPGDSITGKLVNVHVLNGDYGPTPVITLQNAEGETAVLVRGTVFREEMAKREPKIGDELSVTYLGTKTPKSGKGRPYHVYRVQGGTEPEFNWNQYAGERDPSDDIHAKAAAAGPLKIEEPPSQQERAAEEFGDEPPF